MFHPNDLTFAQRSVLPLALLCALGSPSANAATAGMCHYLTNTVIQNVTGYDLELAAQTGYVGGFSIYPALPTTWTLATGGVTGFTQTWGLSNSTTGGQMLFQINDGMTNPQFQFTYWSGVGTSPSTIADALATGAQDIAEEALEDAGKDALEDAGIAAVPPPGDAILATVKILKEVWGIASKIISAFSAEGYLNIDPPDGAFPNNDWPNSNISVNTNQTNTVAVPSYYQGATGETAFLNGYVVSATAINNGCTNSWNVVVTPYCAYVCGYASANNTAIADTNCASTTYCSSTASTSANALFARTITAR